MTVKRMELISLTSCINEKGVRAGIDRLGLFSLKESIFQSQSISKEFVAVKLEKVVFNTT